MSGLLFVRRPLVALAAGTDAAASAQLAVRLFAGDELSGFTVSAAGLRVNAATGQYAGQTCSLDVRTHALRLDDKLLSGPFDGVTVNADQTLTVTALVTGNAAPLVRRYDGALRITASASSIGLINLVGLEDYVASTLASEASSSWAFEALRAQAIAIRSFAVHAAATRRSRQYDVNDDTSSQVYRGVDGITSSFRGAAAATQARILSWRGSPAAVFYSAACGGHTAEVAELGGSGGQSYLAGVADVDEHQRAYCAAAPYFQWKNDLSRVALARVAGIAPETLANCSVGARWPDGRVAMLRVGRNGGPDLEIAGRAFYTRCLQTLGYKVLPSTFFDIAPDGDGFLVTGHGSGHGVGLCQWGARGRADAGFTAEAILRAYFPGTDLMQSALS